MEELKVNTNRRHWVYLQHKQDKCDKNIDLNLISLSCYGGISRGGVIVSK